MVFGNVIHTEPGDDAYMARVVGIKAGVPEPIPAYTVNRLCGTGVQAIVSATQAIQTGEATVALAGGAESMSRGRYWMPSARWGARMGEAELIDPVMGALTDSARAEGRFDEQIVPVPVRVKRDAVAFTRDEHIREDASAETMAALASSVPRSAPGCSPTRAAGWTRG